MAKLIAIDDGHGMETPGKRTPFIPALNRFIHENEWNRAVAGFLNAELKRCGLNTLLTAPTDTDTSLMDRTNLANARKADLFVSIHYNALDGKFDEPNGRDPKGAAVYFYPGAVTAAKLAGLVEGELKKIPGVSQYGTGMIAENFHVLRESHMPAILCECGFMDNMAEALRMVNPEFQHNIAAAIARGVCAFLGVTYKPAILVSAPIPAKIAPAPVPPIKTEPGKLDKQVAQEIIDAALGPLYMSAKAAGHADLADKFHDWADDLRKAAGIPLQT